MFRSLWGTQFSEWYSRQQCVSSDDSMRAIGKLGPYLLDYNVTFLERTFSGTKNKNGQKGQISSNFILHRGNRREYVSSTDIMHGHGKYV